MRNFFYKNWVLYYVTFFLLIGLLIYALLWTPDLRLYTNTINDLNNQLQDCNNKPIKSEPPDKIDNTINCDATANSGGKGETTTQHNLGKSSGTVVIECDMLDFPDEINVYYDNVLVASSNGLVSGKNSVQFKYTAVAGKPTYCIVQISAPVENTAWSYTLNCPQ